MSEANIIEKISGNTLPIQQSIIYNTYRLKAIQSAIQAMKKINMGYLKRYEQTQIWQKINTGLMRYSMQPSLQNIVQFKICQSNKKQKSYFNPYSKKPITMCYNKFIKQQDFNNSLSYNMILYYDSKTKKNMNWNKIQDVVLANVRAIHISGTCKQSDRQCIRNQLESRVFQKQRFKGKSIQRLTQIIIQGLSDCTPISQVNA